MIPLSQFLRVSICFLLIAVLSTCAASQPVPDPLPSWSDGETKRQIIKFVDNVTEQGNSSYVTPTERIATFDNDGTLWSEKPIYFQILFTMYRIKVMATNHPEWTTTQPFKAVLENDWLTLKAAGERGFGTLIKATHSGMTSEEFSEIVNEWMTNARHPTTGKPFSMMVFQPMLELMDYLRTNDFKVFIVSGGSIGFMRPWAEQVYSVPPENIIGSSTEIRYKMVDGKAVIMREPGFHFVNDKAGKPVGIERFIGRRPILAFGNSDGDFHMLEWTTSGNGSRLGLLLHHTDGEREWAYDRESSEGHLDRGLNEASQKGWLIVNMANDWRVIYPPEH